MLLTHCDYCGALLDGLHCKNGFRCDLCHKDVCEDCGMRVSSAKKGVCAIWVCKSCLSDDLRAAYDKKRGIKDNVANMPQERESNTVYF